MQSLVIGLRESDAGFRRNLKLVFADESAARISCAKLLQRFVRGWKARKKAKRADNVLIIKAVGSST